MKTLFYIQNSIGSCSEIVCADQRCDEGGRHSLEVNPELADRHVTSQVFLMNSSKLAQEIPHCRPQPFDRVDMDFSNAIAIIVTCPLPIAVADGLPVALNLIVAFPFVGVDDGPLFGKAVDLVKPWTCGQSRSPSVRRSTRRRT